MRSLARGGSYNLYNLCKFSKQTKEEWGASLGQMGTVEFFSNFSKQQDLMESGVGKVGGLIGPDGYHKHFFLIFLSNKN
jgi:hypothetical protein